MNSNFDRRKFMQTSGTAVGALALGTWNATAGVADDKPSKRKSAWGSSAAAASRACIFPNLSQCPYAEIVSACDIIPKRAADRAAKFKVPNQYPRIDQMLAGATSICSST